MLRWRGALVGEAGEMVITEPMPSMPVAFWNDADSSRYRDAYFGSFPGVWRHGDWLTVTEEGTYIVHGRSDSTINRGGVRMESVVHGGAIALGHPFGMTGARITTTLLNALRTKAART